jgi:hypothetical protein
LLVVLVDHVAEDLPPLNWQVQRSAGLIVIVGWSLLVGLVRPVPVVTLTGLLAEDRSKVGVVVDQHPVGALGSYYAYPSLGVAVARLVKDVLSG